MKTKYKFKIGQRVRLTNEAIQQRLAPWGRQEPCYGTVTNIDPPLGVTVLRDGTKRSCRYHVLFWVPVNSGVTPWKD